MSLGVGIEANLAPAHMPAEMNPAAVPVNPILTQTVFNPNVKDSRWLTLEVCREFTRNKCTRPDTECKFAHPPPHVEVQNGRVTCCFDSIKGKCQRKDPPCKYLHPPQHLREQLLQNGRNNLILKQFQAQAFTNHLGNQLMMPGVYPNMMVEPNGAGGADQQMAAYNAIASAASILPSPSSSAYSSLMAQHNLLPYTTGYPSPFITPMPGMMQQLDAGSAAAGLPQVSAPMGVQTISATNSPNGAGHKVQRTDRLENGSAVSENAYSNIGSMNDALQAASNSQYALYSLQAGMNASMPGVMPVIKRPAVDKSGMPMYQPAGAGAYPPLVQFSQQQFVPVTQTLQYYRGEQTSPYSPVAGHPTTMPRFQ